MDGRMRNALVHFAVLSTILAGIFHVSPWAGAAGMCGLAILGFAGKGASVMPQPRAIGTAESAMAIATVVNASAIAGASFGFGRLTGYLFGL